MNDIHTEGRKTHCDVLRPVRIGGAVANPLAGRHVNGLTSHDLRSPAFVSTRNVPFRTIVYSSNSGVCPGSTQPPGLRM